MATLALLGAMMIALTPGRAAQLRVQWDDNSSIETGFVIERTSDGHHFTEVGSVPANVTAFIDTDVAPATAYWYRVTAHTASERSAPSNITGAMTPLDANTSAEAHWLQNGVPKSKLSNLSARTIPGAGERALIMGFVVKDGPKSVLLRGVGPGIAAYMSAATLADPTLTLQVGTVELLTNDNWGGTDRLKNVFNQVGAFPLAEGSRDAALLADFSPRGYTVLVKGGGSGYAMAEVYDADAAGSSAGRLVNLSVRAQTGNGDDVLIVGFVIAGKIPMRVLIRGGGPALFDLGVNSALTDPQLELYRGNVQWDHNDNWSGDPGVEEAFAESGAFRWTNPRSKDAALVATLPPGNYTALVSGVRGASGVALAEVYELP